MNLELFNIILLWKEMYSMSLMGDDTHFEDGLNMVLSTVAG